MWIKKKILRQVNLPQNDTKTARTVSKMGKKEGIDTKRGYIVSEIGKNGWFRHRTKSQHGRHGRKLPKLTRRKGTTCQKQGKTAETDTEKGSGVAEMSRCGIRIAAIGKVPGRRQQFTPIFAPGTSAERPPAAFSYLFCSRNYM